MTTTQSAWLQGRGRLFSLFRFHLLLGANCFHPARSRKSSLKFQLDVTFIRWTNFVEQWREVVGSKNHGTFLSKVKILSIDSTYVVE
jgi:hypothetical protein